MYEEDYKKVKTFKELAEVLKDQIESNYNKFEGTVRIGDRRVYDTTNARLAFVRLKAESKRDDLPKEIPTDPIDLLSLCESAAQKIMDEEQKPAGNISGMSWKDAKAKAETIIDKTGYRGFSELRKAVGCSEGTLRKAIENSVKLSEAKKQYKPCSSKAVGLTDKVLETQKDPSGSLLSDAEVGEILDDLLRDVAENKPAMLEQTKQELATMDSA